ncbi:MAG TPA: polyprenyl synthetase family protein [Candidatus Paceibacterota bacterium]|jgi:geranylgeranyl diphosphate synthase type I|nr:polyprenyl synthetase family protein [Candidatus Paceibacterota bacterium]
MMSFEEFKQWFDQQFFALLEEKGNEFASYSNEASIKDIVSYISVFAKGGKRLRPYMAYVGYVTEGGEHDLFELFASIELLHLFCLVHDDIMDNAFARHNTKTIHEKFDRSIAILAGDLLLAWSFECMQVVAEYEPYTSDDAMKEYNLLLKEVIHGQMLDVLPTSTTPTKELLEKVIELKTARYSFYRPLALGMILAGGDEEALDFAKSFGVQIGIAFQLIDDLYDWQDDKKNGQHTMVTWYENAHPDDSPQDIRHHIQALIANAVEEAQEAIYAANKDSDPVWEEIVDRFGILR